MAKAQIHTRSVALDALLSVIARVVAMLASTVTALIIVDALSKHEYGAYSLAAGLVGVLAVALDLGVTSSLARYASQGRANGRLVAAIAALRIGLMTIGALVLALVHWIGLFDTAGTGFGSLLLPAAALLVMQGAVAFLYGSLPSFRRIESLLLITILQPLFELLAVLWVRREGGGASEMLLASAAAAGVAALIGYLALLLAPNQTVRVARSVTEAAARVGDVLHYGRRLFLVLLLMMVFGQLDQFLIAAFHNESEVAPYALAIKLQALLIAPMITAVSIIAPRIAGAGELARATYNQWLRFFVLLYAGAVVVFAILARDLFTAINPDYRSDYLMLFALLPCMFFAAIANLPSVTLNQTGYAGSRVRIALITVVINVALDLALVPAFAGYGAAAGTGLAILYYTYAHHRIVVRTLPKTGREATSTRFVLSATGTVMLSALLALLLKPFGVELGDGVRGEAIATVLLAGGAAALVHTVATVMVIRRN